MTAPHKLGGTSLSFVRALGRMANLHLYAKFEYQNPSGSIKDRIAYRMIQDAEASGDLQPGMGIIEVSSGNTGIALSMAGRERGYPVTIVTTNGVTDDAKRMIRGYGGEVVEVDGRSAQGWERVEALQREQPDHFYWPNQAANPSSLASNEDLGREILDDMAGLDIVVFLASMGTGSTIAGVGKALKERNPATQIYLVLPEGEYRAHGVGDYRESTVRTFLSDEERRRAIVDHEIRIPEEAAIQAAQQLDRAGYEVGISSGAVFAAAEQIAGQEAGNAVILFPDRADRYTHLLGRQPATPRRAR